MVVWTAAVLAACSTPPLPSITPEPTNERHVGKFVWRDLLTTDLAAAEADIIERGEMVEKNQVAYDDGSMQVEETITTRNPSIAVRIDAERQIEIVGESLGLQPETLAQLSQNLSEKFMVGMSHTY